MILDNEKKLLNKTNPVVLLENFEGELESKKELLNTVTNIKTYIIGEGNNKRLIIKLQGDNLEENKREILERKAHSLYAKREYIPLLDILIELIISSEKPKPFYFRSLAFTYLNLNNKEKAIMYFIIAEEFSKNKKDKYNFKNLIKKISQ